MALEKNTKIDEVVAELKRRINEGVYVPGQRLPSVRELYEELQVNPATIRSALMRLQAENLIQILPRSGTFVRSPSASVVIGPPRPLPDPNRPVNADEPVLEHFGTFQRDGVSGRFIRSRFLEKPQIIELSQENGERISIKPGTKMLRRYFVLLIGGVPYQIRDQYTMASKIEPLEGDSEYYLPPKYRPAPATDIPPSGILGEKIPLNLVLWSRRRGVEFLRDPKKQPEFRNFEVLACRVPSAEEAALLNIARNQPVIIQEIWTWSYTGGFWEYAYVVVNSALHEFTYTYDVAKDGSRLSPRIP